MRFVLGIRHRINRRCPRDQNRKSHFTLRTGAGGLRWSYGNQGCAGGLMDDAFQYVVAKGLCKETDYPYTGKNGACKLRRKIAVTISGFKDVPPNTRARSGRLLLTLCRN